MKNTDLKLPSLHSKLQSYPSGNTLVMMDNQIYEIDKMGVTVQSSQNQIFKNLSEENDYQIEEFVKLSKRKEYLERERQLKRKTEKKFLRGKRKVSAKPRKTPKFSTSNHQIRKKKGKSQEFFRIDNINDYQKAYGKKQVSKYLFQPKKEVNVIPKKTPLDKFYELTANYPNLGNRTMKKVFPSRKKEFVITKEGYKIIKMYDKPTTDPNDLPDSPSPEKRTPHSFLTNIRETEKRLKKKKKRAKSKPLFMHHHNQRKMQDQFDSPRKMNLQNLNSHRNNSKRMKKMQNQNVYHFQEQRNFYQVLENHFFKFDQNPLKMKYDPKIIRQSKELSVLKSNKSLKDYRMMIEATNRSGKFKAEGYYHYKAGCILEKTNNFKSSSKHFKRFLMISRDLKDLEGECLSLNRLGVLYQNRAVYRFGNTEKSSLALSKTLVKEKKEYLKTALEYHSKHWEKSNKQNQIVAHINMGLIYQQTEEIKDYELSLENFICALRLASEIRDIHGKSLSLLNIGILEKKMGRNDESNDCIIKHLELCKELKDEQAESAALQKLGVIAFFKGNKEKTIELFSKSRELARLYNDQKESNKLKCWLGIIKGSLVFEQKMKQMQKK